MAGFFYSLLLKLLYPTSLALLLLLAAAALQRWKKQTWARFAFWAGIALIFICGSGWVVDAMTRHLEWENLPDEQGPNADAILILSGGISAKEWPRTTVEVGEAGDRLIYGAHLFRQGRAPHIICTGNVATGGLANRPVSEEMAEFLRMLGIQGDVIVTETKSENTFQHAKCLYPLFKERGFARVLLVTSALHMPRSLAVFRRNCPGIDFIPAPTDFRSTRKQQVPWYRHLVKAIPTPSNLLAFNEAAHEYLGIAYYRLRGWI